MRILFIVTEDWYFASHRLEFARRLVRNGNEVYLVAQDSGCGEQLEEAGVMFVPVDFFRKRTDPLSLFRTALTLRKVIRRVNPDIIHMVALRAILVGWISTLWMKRAPIVNAVTGLGSLYSPYVGGVRLRMIREVMNCFLKFSLGRARTWNVWQNEDDLNEFAEKGISPRVKSRLIRGAGVSFGDRNESPLPPQNTVPVVVFIGRFLREKGIGELIEASNRLIVRGVEHALFLIGSPDDCNPLSFDSAAVEEWKRHPHIKCLGRRSDVDDQMVGADIVAVPTYYREGLPKVLLEAGRAGRPAITTSIPGCRDVVVDGENGVLVAPKDVGALESGLERLILDEESRRLMGSRNFDRVRALFSDEPVYLEFERLYDEIRESQR